jgi:hypothetical protein
MATDRFDEAIRAIDAANVDDPFTLLIDGEMRPKEQAHAELMTRWVRRLDPDATDAQLLAARAHHLRRWTMPRTEFPDGRAGYLKWRAEAKRRHADEVAEILRRCDYDEVTIERVQQIIRKDHLRTDPVVQVHEDALCLVFLETQLGEVADRLGPEKGSDVLRKTVAKMSDRGREAAQDLPLPDAERQLVTAVLREVTDGL